MLNTDIISSIIIFLLGAIFGASAVFYSMKDKLKSLRQASASRSITMLEQVAQHTGKVSHVFRKYSSVVTEIGPKSERMTAKQVRELDDLSNQLVDVYEQATIAESKLLLLGEQRLEKALKLYTGKMAQYRKQIYPGRYSNADEANKLRNEVSEMREQFYTILSERYDQKIGQ